MTVLLTGSDLNLIALVVKPCVLTLCYYLGIHSEWNPMMKRLDYHNTWHLCMNYQWVSFAVIDFLLLNRNFYAIHPGDINRVEGVMRCTCIDIFPMTWIIVFLKEHHNFAKPWTPDLCCYHSWLLCRPCDTRRRALCQIGLYRGWSDLGFKGFIDIPSTGMRNCKPICLNFEWNAIIHIYIQWLVYFICESWNCETGVTDHCCFLHLV